MGWPALIGLALTAAGTGVESYASAQTAKNEESTAQSQINQQKQLQGKATSAFNQNLPNNSVEQAKAQVSTGQQQQQDVYKSLAAQTQSGGQSPVNVDPVVQARADASTQNQGASSAKLQGYSQWGVNQAIQNMLAGQQIGLVNNQAQNLAQTFGPNMAQAAGSESGLTGIGGLLNTLGSAVGVGGTLAGYGGGAGAPTTQQSSALQAGYGPVNAGYANQVYPQAQFKNILSAWGRNPQQTLY